MLYTINGSFPTIALDYQRLLGSIDIYWALKGSTESASENVGKCLADLGDSKLRDLPGKQALPLEGAGGCNII